MRRLMMVSSMVFLSLVLTVIPTRGAGLFSFTTIDGPGDFAVPGTSYALGINHTGAVVGWYDDTRYNGSVRGFYYRGYYITIDYPDAVTTAASGTNDNNQIVGYYYTTTRSVGFLLDPAGYHSIDFGRDTLALGINNLGQIVGYYTATNHIRGFLLAGGSFSPIDYTDATFAASYTRAAGINDVGQIVGWYLDRTGNGHGFLRDAQGRYTSIDYPGGRETSPGGINNSGWIVGNYLERTFYVPPKSHGFLRDAQGRYTSIDYPGATSTFASGINNPDAKGRYSIVGYYYGTDNRAHGFVATPCGRRCIPLF